MTTHPVRSVVRDEATIQTYEFVRTSESNFYADVDEDEDGHKVERAQLEHLFVLAAPVVRSRSGFMRWCLSDLRETGYGCQDRSMSMS